MPILTKAGTPYLAAQVTGFAGGSILDIGAGNLSILACMTKLSWVPAPTFRVGVDFAYRRMAAMRESYPEVTWLGADAHALPFRDGAFDFVTIGRVLELVDDPLKVTAEAKRVLKSGGQFTCIIYLASTGYGQGVWRFTVQDASALLAGLTESHVGTVSGTEYKCLRGRKL